MTIDQAITAIDGLKYNTYTREEKLLWLSEMEGRIHRELMETHDDGPEEPFQPFTPDTPGATELAAPWPYDKLYIHQLEMMMDYHNGEMERYNNAARMLSAVYSAYSRFYNRHHLPKTAAWRFP